MLRTYTSHVVIQKPGREFPMDLIDQINAALPIPRFTIVILLAVLAHVAALLARQLFMLLGQSIVHAALTKVRTVVHLISGISVFTIYFFATGLILAEMGVSITAYLASASVIGLAVGFGSQSIVQDVITGLTVILSDLIEVNDMVEISGQTGIVKSVGMRFTVLQNAMGANVYIPNRTLNSLINYPRGYVRCIVDIELSDSETDNNKTRQVVEVVTQSVKEQFPSVFRAPIEIEGVRTTSSGKQFLRVKFRIWPGRGSIIETTFRQDLIAKHKSELPNAPDLLVAINYEVDQTRPNRA